MKVLIVEDEISAATRLKNILLDLDVEIEILDVLETVSATVSWLESNQIPELIFLDIQLSDGISFDIFKDKEINCPIIFVTAFDKYTIDAFKVNSIDYILKPYLKSQIDQAIKKYHKVKNYNLLNINKAIINELSHVIKTNYKNRFFTKLNNQVYSISIEEISYFTFDHNATVLVGTSFKKFVINYSLDALEKMLDPQLFFRINRNFILHISSIKRMNISQKSRILIVFANGQEQDVSKARTKDFKMWLDA